MKRKKLFVISSLTIMLVSSVSPFINNKSVYASEAETTDTAIKELTYEESQNLPLANILKDTNTELYGPQSRGISLYSVSNPSSITDYKNLGYKNIYYTGWTGDKIVMSTKSVRITTFVATNILGFIPSRLVSAAIALYDLSSELKTQNPDIWPTVNTRNIIATSPIGYEVIIGQETIVKYYGNSSRTKLIKTIQKIYWVG